MDLLKIKKMLNSCLVSCNVIATEGYSSILTNIIFILERFTKLDHLCRKVRANVSSNIRASRIISSAVISYTINTHFFLQDKKCNCLLPVELIVRK